MLPASLMLLAVLHPSDETEKRAWVKRWIGEREAARGGEDALFSAL